MSRELHPVPWHTQPWAASVELVKVKDIIGTWHLGDCMTGNPEVDWQLCHEQKWGDVFYDMEAFKADVAANGLLVPSVYLEQSDGTGLLLNGHHRLVIAYELDLTWFPVVERSRVRGWKRTALGYRCDYETSKSPVYVRQGRARVPA